MLSVGLFRAINFSLHSIICLTEHSFTCYLWKWVSIFFNKLAKCFLMDEHFFRNFTFKLQFKLSTKSLERCEWKRYSSIFQTSNHFWLWNDEKKLHLAFGVSIRQKVTLISNSRRFFFHVYLLRHCASLSFWLVLKCHSTMHFYRCFHKKFTQSSVEKLFVHCTST